MKEEYKKTLALLKEELENLIYERMVLTSKIEFREARIKNLEKMILDRSKNDDTNI
jgi:hypothetical protein